MATRERPLSPFMTYRWQYTNTLSILNRITGVVLTLGLVPLTCWLVAIASGPEQYQQAEQILSHPLANIGWVALSFSFFYHLLSGIRHLAWDVGHGFDLRVARISGWSTFIGSLVLTAIFWALLARTLGGAV